MQYQQSVAAVSRSAATDLRGALFARYGREVRRLPGLWHIQQRLKFSLDYRGMPAPQFLIMTMELGGIDI